MPWQLILRLAPYILILLLTASTWFYRTELGVSEVNHKAFVTVTEMAGEQARIRDKGRSDGWKQQGKDAADRATVAGRKLAEWVRRSSAGSIVAPASTGTPRGTDREGQVCYDEAELNGALRVIEGLIGEGAQAVIDRQEMLEAWPR